MSAELPKIIAVDFDGTLVEDNFPEAGKPNLELIQLLKTLQGFGVKVILWTCRTGKHLFDAVHYCLGHDLIFDAVNENLPEVQKLYGGDTRKVFADLYIDDKAIPHCQSALYWAHRLGLNYCAIRESNNQQHP